MTKSVAALLVVSLFAGVAGAQPASTADTSTRTVSPYLYLSDSQNNKILLSTQFLRKDPKYDDRAFHRFLDVLSGLEKRGFHRDDKAVIDDWDKPENDIRCYIYLEDLQAGRTTKSGTVTGSRVWCSGNGASEHEIRGSDNAKHVDQVLQSFDLYFGRAKSHPRG